MKNKKKSLKAPVSVIVLFVVAAVLIVGGAIGATLAWTYPTQVYSEEYKSQFELKDIGVSLLENHKSVSHRDYKPNSNYVWNEEGSTYRLCDDLLGEDEELKIGKRYKEELSVFNSGNIDEYVRVNVYKYWAEVDENGEVVKKRPDLDPSLIEVNFVTDDGWIQDPYTDDDEERTTLYYSQILKAGGEEAPESEGPTESSLFVDSIKINDVVALKAYEKITYEEEWTVVTTYYDYDGVSFIIEAEVDAVQTHNAQAAIKSAWGRDVEIENGVITSLK